MASTWSPPALLGVCDAACPEALLSPYQNKIGGYPDFFPSAALGAPPSCRLCHAPLPLLLQVYCPLDGSPYHRLLHVFCCPKPSCCGQDMGWLVIRSQLRDPSYCTEQSESETRQQTSDQGSWELRTTDWCVDADDWGSDNEDTRQFAAATTTPEKEVESHKSLPACATAHGVKRQFVSAETKRVCVATEMAKLSLEDSEVHYLGPFFPPQFIRVTEAVTTDLDPVSAAKIQSLIQKYQKEHQEILDDHIPGGSSTKRKQASALGTGGRGHGEGYEKVIARHGDRAFQKFYKHLSKCPEQIMRYCLKGTPLLITSSHTQQPPEGIKCKHCRTPCVFEFQLMPPLVYLIQTVLKDDKALRQKHSISERRGPGNEFGVSSGIEFGTVLVFTCSASCWDDSTPTFREESVIVQRDPDDKIVQQFLQEIKS